MYKHCTCKKPKVKGRLDPFFRHGPDKLREFPGFHDEKLKGDLEGKRSSRLSIQYRVIYSVEKETISIYVIDITPHKY